MIGTTLRSISANSVLRAFRYPCRSARSPRVRSVCATMMPSDENSSSQTCISRVWPTAASTCLNGMSRLRSLRRGPPELASSSPRAEAALPFRESFSACLPATMAPDDTSATWCPSRTRRAIWRATPDICGRERWSSPPVSVFVPTLTTRRLLLRSRMLRRSFYIGALSRGRTTGWSKEGGERSSNARFRPTLRRAAVGAVAATVVDLRSSRWRE